MAEWYYRLNEVVQGPVNEADLEHIFASGALPLTTPVWCEGMVDWVEAKSISQLSNSTPNTPTVAQPYPNSKNPGNIRTSHIIIACVTILLGLWLLTPRNNFQTEARPHESATQFADLSAGNDHSSQVAIQNVLYQSQLLENAITFDTNSPFCDTTVDDFAMTLRTFVEKARALNTDACPRSFAEAYYNYLAAVDSYADSFAAHPHLPESVSEGFIEGMFKGLAGC